MLYDRNLIPEQVIEPVRWTVGGFTLVHSRLGRTEHIPLGRWTLG
jgi:2'-5' RNA ligase